MPAPVLAFNSPLLQVTDICGTSNVCNLVDLMANVNAFSTVTTQLLNTSTLVSGYGALDRLSVGTLSVSQLGLAGPLTAGIALLDTISSGVVEAGAIRAQSLSVGSFALPANLTLSTATISSSAIQYLSVGTVSAGALNTGACVAASFAAPLLAVSTANISASNAGLISTGALAAGSLSANAISTGALTMASLGVPLAQISSGTISSITGTTGGWSGTVAANLVVANGVQTPQGGSGTTYATQSSAPAAAKTEVAFYTAGTFLQASTCTYQLTTPGVATPAQSWNLNASGAHATAINKATAVNAAGLDVSGSIRVGAGGNQVTLATSSSTLTVDGVPMVAAANVTPWVLALPYTNGMSMGGYLSSVNIQAGTGGWWNGPGQYEASARFQFKTTAATWAPSPYVTVGNATTGVLNGIRRIEALPGDTALHYWDYLAPFTLSSATEDMSLRLYSDTGAGNIDTATSNMAGMYVRRVGP